jgi:4,5-DOPA dioxygenase extradiol
MSHGAPPLADDLVWTEELVDLASSMSKPTAILVVSAHWEEAPLTIGAIRTVPLFYDFYGFPERYYQVTYPAPGAPDLADQVRKLLQAPTTPITDDPERGLDHGAYVPLVEMYPEADIPVLQISMPTLDPDTLMRVGQRLAPLRDLNVLIVGSGFSTHNLKEMVPPETQIPTWSQEFDHWLKGSLETKSFDELLDFQKKAPASFLAHPTTEHFAPLFVALGASIDQFRSSETVIDGFWYGLSKRTVLFN